jgi:hypothetical protein
MDQEKRMRSVGNVTQQATAAFADAQMIARRSADDGPISVLSSDASLHTSVQQLIQQHRQETTSIDEKQRTTRSGNEHEENTSEQVQTIPTVSRIRYPIRQIR